MTLEEAKNIRKLMDVRDDLMAQLKEFERCESIDGHINDGVNGLGFYWDKGHRHIQYLKDGLKKDIATIEETISNIQIKGG